MVTTKEATKSDGEAPQRTFGAKYLPAGYVSLGRSLIPVYLGKESVIPGKPEECTKIKCTWYAPLGAREEQAKRKQSELLARSVLRPHTLWASVAAIGALPDPEARSGLPLPKPAVVKAPLTEAQKRRIPVAGYSPKWGRRDFWRDVAVVKDERESFRQLAESIAARTAKKIELAEKPSVTARKQRKAAIREMLRRKAFFSEWRAKREASRPTFTGDEVVADFDDVMCIMRPHGELYIPLSEAEREFGLFMHAGKQKKIRSRCYALEHDQGCHSQPREFPAFVGRVARQASLRRKLAQTPIGRALLEGLTRVLYSRMTISQQESTERVCRGMELPLKPEPQMDEGASATEIDQRSNVVLKTPDVSARSESIAKISGFKAFSISKERQVYETMTDRWIMLGQFQWKDTHSEGQEIFSLKVLKDILVAAKDSQNAQLFFSHRLVRTDVRLKFIVNCNRYLVGQCVADVLYQNANDDVALWNNVYSAMQRQHVKIVANESTNAELIIPYRNVNSMVAPSLDSFFAMVKVRVLNPIIATNSTVGTGNVTVMATFENTEFSGMISRSVGSTLRTDGYAHVSPQMDTIASLMNAGSNLIRSIRADPNRDNPPRPLQPVSFVPQAMSSLAYMDNIEDPVNVLRADPRGQTPHADFKDEMNPYLIANKWGYLKTIEWTAALGSGDELFSFDVVPLMDDGYRDITLTGRELKAQIYTPLAYISNLYSRYRGDLEFKFEVVASGFHTGSFMVGSIPLKHSSETINMSVLKYSAYSVFDIETSSASVYRAPWHWINAFARVRRSSKCEDVPSKLYAFVVNPLCHIAQVVNKVYVNVYVRAAENFELSLPRAPVLDPYLLDLLKPPSTEYLKPWNTECAWYTTWNRNLKMSDGKYAMTNYYGTQTDQYVSYTNVITGAVYELQEVLSTSPERRYRVYYKDASGATVKVRFGVYVPALAGSNSHGLVICKEHTSVDPMKYAKALATAVYLGQDVTAALTINAPTWYSDGDWSSYQQRTGTGWTSWAPATNDLPSPRWLLKWTVTKPNLDEDPVTVLETPSVTTALGLQVFGERTPDLKSLCRRYVHCTTVMLNTCTSGHPRDCPYAARMKVFPIRQLDVDSSASYDNRYRHGTITQVGSMFRGWRGGLRYRFVVIGNPPEGTVLYVSHRYDQIMAISDTYVQNGPTSIVNRDDLMNTHYASYGQVLNVNGSFTVEVPYYSEKEFLSCLPNANAEDSYNGSLYIWLHSKVSAEVHLEVFYSVADDFRYSVFQGCPASIDLNVLSDEPKSVFSRPQPLSDSQADNLILPQMDTNEPQMLSGVTNKVSEALTGVANRVLSNISFVTTNGETKRIAEVYEAGQKISMTMGELKDAINAGSSPATFLGYNTEKLVMGYRIFSEIVHMVIGNCSGSYVWGAVNILIAILPRFDFFFTCRDKLVAFLESVCSTEQTQGATPQMSFMDTDFIGLLCQGLALYCGISLTDTSSLCGIATGLFLFGGLARGATYLSCFLRDVLELFKRACSKIAGYLGDVNPDYKLFEGTGDDRLDRWVSDALYLTAPSQKERIPMSAHLMNQVFECGVKGRALLLVACKNPKIPQAMVNQIRTLVDKLKAVEDFLVNSKQYCGARLEPACIWVSGPAGCLKTTLMKAYVQQKMIKMGFTNPVPYYIRTAGNDYFDGFSNQGCVFLDDFGITKPTHDPAFYSQFLQMKSAGLFNPPFAEAHNKNKLINFPLLVVTSNFPKVLDDAAIHDVSAYNRRRDIVLKFDFRADECPTKADGTKKLVPNAANLLELFTYEELKAGKHLLVSRYTDVLSTREAEKEYIECDDTENMTDKIFGLIDSVVDEKLELYARQYNEDCVSFRKGLEQISSGEDIKATMNKYHEFMKAHYASKKVSSVSQPMSFFKEFTLEGCKSAGLVVSPQSGVETKGLRYSGCLVEKPKYCTPFEIGGPVCKSVTYDHCTLPTCTKVFEPVSRLGSDAADYSGACTHKDLIGNGLMIFDETTNVLGFIAMDYQGPTVALSTSVEPCLAISADGKFLVKNDNCCMHKLEGRQSFCKSILERADSTAYLIPLSKALSSVYKFSRTTGRAIEEADRSGLLRRDAIIAEMMTDIRLSMQSKYSCIGDVVISLTRPLGNCSAWLWSKIVGVLGWVWTILKYTALVIVAIVTVCCTYEFLSGNRTCVGEYFHLPDGRKVRTAVLKRFYKSEGQLEQSGDYVNIKRKVTKQAKAMNLVQANGEDAADQFDSIVGKLSNNTFFMVGVRPDGLETKARCLGIGGKRFLVLKHYMEFFTTMGISEVSIVLFKVGKVATVKIRDIGFYWAESGGYGVGELPTFFSRQFAKLTKFMPSQSFSGSYPSKGCILEINYRMDEWTVNRHLVDLKSIQDDIEVSETKHATAWTISQGFKYSWAGKGRCGSLVLIPSLAAPLAAIHTAGVGTLEGYGELLLRESFEDFVKNEVEYTVPQMDDPKGAYRLSGDYEPVAKLTPELKPSFSQETRIRPSVIQGVFPVSTEPAPLSSRDERLEPPSDIFRIGVSKRCKPLLEFNAGDMKTVSEDMESMLLTSVVPCRSLIKPLSIVEAIEGFEIKGYEPMELSTSEGYPWVICRPTFASNKSWLFDHDYENSGRLRIKGIQRDLYETLKIKEKSRERGVVPATFFTACLKDARILREKVSIPGKTRIFEMSPVELTIAQRQYFSDFYAAYRASWEAEHTIGINPDGAQWSRFAKELVTFSPYILTADYSGYGPSLSHTILEKGFGNQIAWLEFHENTSANTLVRECIKHEVVHGYHVAKNLVFVPTSGLPSGNAATVENNSIGNSYYIRLAYLTLARENALEYADLIWFYRFVYLRHNGDDLIMSVKQEIIEWFNNVTLIEFFSRYGLKMTDALKSGSVTPYCSLEEATYLKRGFLKHPVRSGEWLAPLEVSSILDTANWIWKSVDMEQASFINSEMCSRLAYTRGPEFYQWVCETLRQAWLKRGRRFMFPTWTSLDRHIWDGFVGPKFSFE